MQESIAIKRVREGYLTHPIVVFNKKGKTDPFPFSLLYFSPPVDVNGISVPENNMFRMI